MSELSERLAALGVTCTAKHVALETRIPRVKRLTPLYTSCLVERYAACWPPWNIEHCSFRFYLTQLTQ